MNKIIEWHKTRTDTGKILLVVVYLLTVFRIYEYID